MNEMVKTQKAINLCIKKMLQYQPIHYESYLPIYKKLKLLGNIQTFAIILMPVSIIIFLVGLIGFGLNIPIVSSKTFLLMVAASIIIFILAYLSATMFDKIEEKILLANNLVVYSEAYEFKEISIKGYEKIKELSSEYPELKEKIDQILSFRKHGIYTVDYLNLCIFDLYNLSNDLKNLKEHEKKRNEILDSLSS